MEIEAKKILAKEEYYKRLEEERLIEDAKNKKGGKTNAPKAKDPKKYGQELEDRFKEIMKFMNSHNI